MKYYRHYKNKPYKLLGIARHTETLEELALYETRYENVGGKIWVRPKDMFFESVTIDGKEIPRFKEMTLDITAKTEVSDQDIEVLAELTKKTFGEWDPKWFFSTFNQVKNIYLQIARIEGQPVAFKLGYSRTQTEFYSWLGAVLPEYRGLGIASDLMKAQHAWCKSQGYQVVETKTQNRFREMLLLNISAGFEIIGTHDSNEAGLKIILRKKLT